MKNPKIQDYAIKSSEGKITFLPPTIRHLHSLAKYLLRDYLESQLYTYSNKGKVQCIIDIIETQNNDYTLETALYPISNMVVSSYNLLKKKGIHPLNARDKRQLIFVIEKCFRASIEYFKS